VLDIVFLPVVAVITGRLLLKRKMYRNLFLPIILTTLGILNASFYLSALGFLNVDANTLLFASLYLIVMIEIMIGNRIIPSFTANAVIGLSQFRNATLATRGKPILWILHVSYGWMPVGFLLLGLSRLGIMTIYPALHVFGIGVTGGLIISMITRTALGHTGRPLKAGSIELASYLCIQGALIIWLLSGMGNNSWFYPLLVIAGTLWCATFGLYLYKYIPLPTIRRFAHEKQQLSIFHVIENRFAFIARFSVVLAGLSGLYMVYALNAWDRFTQIQYFWMYAMVLLWLMFAFALFIIEPFLFKNHGRIVKGHGSIMNLRKTAIVHWIIFILSLATIFVSVLGAHGFLY